MSFPASSLQREQESPNAPAYFERIRAEAAARCDLLERDPVLAAPTQQLFKQIRNPRFVLSELLQNADDVGARRVQAWIADGAFHFEHDGEDFQEDHFASLCRFGFSNKRHLHTIGFRGLGFKSVFSYGPVVELTTPSLSVRFHESRFTEPVWGDSAQRGPGTRVSVQFRNPDVAQLASDELRRWASSPVPLLFFRSIQELELDGHLVRRVSRGAGPMPSSEWVDLEGTDERGLLVIRSASEMLSEEGIEEVRGERMDPDFSAAEASIELVVGLKARNRLYVVLPTTVEWGLPFAINAPFVQDPARTAIKEPAQSPLNRWLLRRAGQLTAEAMLAWLARTDLSVAERAAAYELLGPAKVLPNTLAGSAGATVLEAMRAGLGGRNLMLTADAALVAPGRALDLPASLEDVWPQDVACAVFGGSCSHVLSRDVPGRARDGLASWQVLTRIGHRDVVARLSAADVSVPRPNNERLLSLWSYLADGARNRWDSAWIDQVQIFPAYGDESLRRSTALVAPDESVESISDEDWEYLSTLLPLVDAEWLQFVGIHASDEGLANVREHGKRPEGVAVLWAWSKLAHGTDVDGMIARAAKTIADRKSETADAIPLARVAARLGASVDQNFPYLTGLLSTASFNAHFGIIAPEDARRDLIPPNWLTAFGLNDRYEEGLSREELATWHAWVKSPKSCLKGFVTPMRSEQRVGSRKAVESLYRERGGITPLSFPYRRDNFVAEDHDFGKDIWKHWEALGAEDPTLWGRVVEAIGENWTAYADSLALSLHQDGNSYRRTLEADHIQARWLQRMAALPCLPDEFGRMELPGALLRHTSNTAFLHGVESFLHPDLDRAELHPLLDLLGVRSDPSDAATLLGRLRALAQVAQPPMDAVLRIYLALDRVFSRLPADKSADVIRAFAGESLIRTDDGGWTTTDAVFVENVEQIPGVPVLWREAARLALWRQVGVSPRPDAERIIAWLRERPLNEKLEGPVRQRVRPLLAGMPERVWSTCQAWIDLEDRWVPASHLRFWTARPVVGQRLFSSVRMETADVSMVASDYAVGTLFEGLQHLDDLVELQPLHIVLRPAPRPDWLAALARSILRIEPRELHTIRQADAVVEGASMHPDHEVARALLSVVWSVSQELQVVPHIAGRVVGAHRTVHALWSDGRIAVSGRQAVYYKELVDVLNARFTTPAVRSAVAACVDRSPAWIEDYFATEFHLGPELLIDEDGPVATEHAPSSEVAAPSDTRGEKIPLAAPAPSGATESIGLDDLREEPVVAVRRSVASPAATDSRGEREATGFRADVAHPVRIRSHQRSGAAWLGPVIAVLEAFGYVRLGEGHTFHHEDGGRAVLGGDGLAHAVAFDADGAPRARFWAGDTPLTAGVEIPADVWGFLERSKDSSWIVLPDGDGVVAHPLATLEGAIELFPAVYRIRLRKS